MKLNEIPLSNTDELSWNSSTECPKRILDAVRQSAHYLPHLKFHDYFSSMGPGNYRGYFGCFGDHRDFLSLNV